MTSTIQHTSESATEDTIIEARNLTVSFGSERGESRVLNSANIDVHRNEILGVIGESGSGKSMFAAAMLDAVVEPGVISGELTYYPGSGEPVDILNLEKPELKAFRWDEIAMVFQGAMSSFNPVRNIKSHFEDTLIAHDYNVESYMERGRELLSDLYLDPDRVLNSYPHELSGGMKQRVLIALSLLLDPEVLVMDEPTAALDLLMQRSIISLIEDLQKKHDLSIVFITHDLPLIAGLADRLAVMYAFEFAEVGPAYDILTDATHPYTRALLRSTPNLTTPLQEMEPVEGRAPDPVNTPQGCSYRPRCPLADETCEIDPDPYTVSDDHHVHCHHWEKSSDAIPMFDETSSETRSEWDQLPSPSHSEEPLISLSDLEVHFESKNGGLFDFSEPEIVEAVNGVSVDIDRNDVLVLVGESGCGKTTLGKAAVGIQKPTGGSVTYKGQDIWDAKFRMGDIQIPFEDIRRSLQIVHQDPGSALNSNRRVKSILADPLKRWNTDLNSEDRLQRILGMLEYVGMSPPEDYVRRYPHQLSGGEQQRIALIRSMLMSPDLILADEAVSALDVSLRVEMMDLMIELQKQFNTSYLVVSHNLSNARYIAGMTGGKIAVMYLGEIVEIGTPEQIITDPQHPYTKALCWATPELDPDKAQEDDETPMRKIDIPDPTNPPTGCRYHTRCPEAREACTEMVPSLEETDHGQQFHEVACFRSDETHEYWQSDPIVEEPDD